MSIQKQYDPSRVEDKWYSHWMEKRYFHSEPDEREPYTIVIPPPNVTGVLHMGHILNNTIQDILIRRARLKGYNACWVPGTDHASIATEAKVVKKLAEEGISKSDLTREEFLKHAWEWKEKHGGIILQQLKKLGASCDWDRTRFTMEPALSEAVIDVFIDLYNKGLIYKGYRIVNWDPKALTAVSDEEVIYREVQSKLWYVRYRIEGTEDEWLTIATTRPETILGDTAICVHPEDPRFGHLKGKRAIVPLVERPVPVIFDEYVDMEFGTGCLKVTPAHDPNDYELGLKHKLDIIDTLNPDGTLNEKAQFFVGEDRFVVREKIVEELRKRGHLVKEEDYVNKVGFSERTNEVIEPRLSEQWFLSMKELTKPALENVLNGNIRFFPAKFVNTYRHWMENVRDWCISRQLWWGQRIPAWYNEDGDIVVCKTEEEARRLLAEKYPDKANKEIRQDEDVVDTWFSSWLWPISVFDGFKDPDNPDIRYYYPTNDLVTAPEILFFWVARMIMAGYEYRGEKPFRNVYLTGIVRDKKGRKMSKSLGNSPDPLLLISRYGADGVRVGMLFSSPAGNDLLFDEKLCEQGRNFCNKIWNALRLVKSWNTAETGASVTDRAAIGWFGARLSLMLEELESQMQEYRISEALKKLYSFIWDDFCSWYLEMIKPAYGEAISSETYELTLGFFEDILRMLHPFMPFITEEIWHHLRQRAEGDDLIVNHWPDPRETDAGAARLGDLARDIISRIRDLRNRHGISRKEKTILYTGSGQNLKLGGFEELIRKLGDLAAIESTETVPDGSYAFVLGQYSFYLKADTPLNKEQEAERLEKEIRYLEGFIASVEKKLGNERFVQNAPEAVVARERKKLEDGKSRLASLRESLKQLNGV